MFDSFKSLLDFLNTSDLIALGLYINRDSAYQARKNGNSPEYLKVGRRKILYSKKAVIEFLEHCIKNPSNPGKSAKSMHNIEG